MSLPVLLRLLLPYTVLYSWLHRVLYYTMVCVSVNSCMLDVQCFRYGQRIVDLQLYLGEVYIKYDSRLHVQTSLVKDSCRKVGNVVNDSVLTDPPRAHSSFALSSLAHFFHHSICTSWSGSGIRAHANASGTAMGTAPRILSASWTREHHDPALSSLTNHDIENRGAWCASVVRPPRT